MLTLLQAWAEANCTSADACRDLMRNARRAEQAQFDFHLLVGAKLTKQRKAYLLHLREGELFVFALTTAQAKQRGVSGRSLVFAFDGLTRRAQPQLMHIDRVDLDHAEQLGLHRRITGRCTYHVESVLTEQPCLQFDLGIQELTTEQRGMRTTLTCYPHVAMPKGTITFDFYPLKTSEDSDVPTVGQTLVGFMPFCTCPDPGRNKQAIPLSNPVGILVRI